MIAPSDRRAIVVAGAGPLIRLAAAGLRDTRRGRSRRILPVDSVEHEAAGDRTKPSAAETAAWIAAGEAAARVETVVGTGVAAARAGTRTPEREALSKAARSDSGEQASPEFVGHRRRTRRRRRSCSARTERSRPCPATSISRSR